MFMRIVRQVAQRPSPTTMVSGGVMMGLTVCVIALVWVSSSQAQNFQNSLRQSTIVPMDFLEEVYQDPDFLPLIDINQAQIQLEDLSRAFQRTLNQYALLDDKKDELHYQQLNVQREILTILRDTRETQTRMQDALTRISLYSQRIHRMEKNMAEVRADLIQERQHLAQYVKFLYKTHNDISFEDQDVSILRLLAQSGNMAENLSMRELGKLLTVYLQEMMEEMANKHYEYRDMQRVYAEARSKYRLGVRFYQQSLTNLQEQQSNLQRLLSYIQTNLAQTQREASNIEETRSLINQQITQMERIQQQHGSPVDEMTPVGQLLQIVDRDPGQRFFSWPVFPPDGILHGFRDADYLTRHGHDLDAIRIDIPQRSDVYAPAPWVVYRVYPGAGLRKSWVIILHRHGYATVLSPLADIFVEEGQLVQRGEIIGRSGGMPGTQGAWLGTPWPHLDFQVLHNGEPADPFMFLDISIFNDKELLPQRYHTKYLQDYFAREVDLTILSLSGETTHDRAVDFLRKYATAPFHQMHLWYTAAQGTNINPYFGVCIWFAETSFKNFKTPNNIGNVGNNDRGDTVTYDSPVEGMRALFSVLNNQYLWSYQTLNQLSRFGNRDGFIYASSPYNRQKNIMNCLSSIYDFNLPEDFSFRVSVQ